MLDVRRLVLLREVATRGTLAAVAEALSYSPSAVSQQLTLLSKEAGVPLLRRSGRRVVLTPAAELLVATAGEVLAVLERAQSRLAAVAAASGPVTGRVRVAVFQSAALALVPGALLALAAEHPGLRVEVVQREPGAALHETAEHDLARDFDLVVAEEYPAHAAPHLPGLLRTELVRDALRLALPPLAVGGEAVHDGAVHDGAVHDGAVHDGAVHDLAGAAGLPWVMEPPGTASRHFAEQTCRTAGFEPDVRYESADLQTQIRLVETGCAVALLPDLVWAGREATCRLVELPGAPRRTVFVAQRASGAELPAAAAVIAALQAQATSLPTL